MAARLLIGVFLVAAVGCGDDDGGAVPDDCPTGANVTFTLFGSTHDCAAGVMGEFQALLQDAYAGVALCEPVQGLAAATTFGDCSVAAMLSGTWDAGYTQFLGNAGLTFSGCADACMAGMSLRLDATASGDASGMGAH